MGAWSVRLAVRIWRKNHGKPEDARYAAWRTAWNARGKLYFILRSFLQINVLQGIIIAIVALPVILASAADASITSLTLIGGLVYLFGLGYETLADYQLDQFLARKRAGTEPAVLMTTGLFRYSRRPNYFGETLIWWGLALMVLPLPFGWLAIASPLLITFIVTRVTGPMLEDIFLQKYPAEYRAYMDQTSYFIPLPPRH
jgi:steroid 5-alpha reductase family enzyme